MHKAGLVLMVLGAACVVAAAPAAAGESPFCIKGCDFGSGVGDCSFSSYQQCLAAASGRDATCATNPYFNRNAGLASNKVSRRRY